MVTILQPYAPASTIQISGTLAEVMKNIKPYSTENLGILYSTFSPPLNVVIGNSGQSLVEYVLAMEFSRLGKDMLGLLELERYPQILIAGTGMAGASSETLLLPNECIWSFGSPYRNPVTRLLASNQNGEDIAGLDSRLKTELPYCFKIDDVNAMSGGYLSYEEFKAFADAKVQLQNEINQNPKIKLSLDIRVNEPFAYLVDANGARLVPKYSEEGQRFTEDYFMIAQTPSIVPSARNLGQSDVLVAGCHDLGTWSAIGVFFNEDLMRQLKKEVGAWRTFQAIGSATPNYTDLREVVGISK